MRVRHQNSTYLAQRRKGRKEKRIVISTEGRNLFRSLAFARDDRPCPSLGVLGVPSTRLRTCLARGISESESFRLLQNLRKLRKLSKTTAQRFLLSRCRRCVARPDGSVRQPSVLTRQGSITSSPSFLLEGEDRGEDGLDLPELLLLGALRPRPAATGGAGSVEISSAIAPCASWLHHVKQRGLAQWPAPRGQCLRV